MLLYFREMNKKISMARHRVNHQKYSKNTMKYKKNIIEN